ncbi:MAG: hypothetical protein DMG85_06295 [Acidobacteria bacterium]|nr:MAG: hypothetical protein DMG85_06295 [Acidobacteriota bacterium]
MLFYFLVYPTHGLIFQCHGVLNRADVFGSLRSGALLYEFLNASVFRNNGIYQFAPKLLAWLFRRLDEPPESSLFVDAELWPPRHKPYRIWQAASRVNF